MTPIDGFALVTGGGRKNETIGLREIDIAATEFPCAVVARERCCVGDDRIARIRLRYPDRRSAES